MSRYTPADMTQLTSRGEDRGEDLKVLVAVHVDALHLDGFDTCTHTRTHGGAELLLLLHSLCAALE